MAEEYVISVVLEGNASSLSSATDKASNSQKRLKTSTVDANISMLIFLAYKTLSIAMSYGDAKAKTTDAAATGVLTAATAKLNVVMAMNPFILIAMAIVVVVAALWLLEKKFGIITSAVDMLNDALKAMDDVLGRIRDGLAGMASGLQDVLDKLTLKGLRDGLHGVT
mgnify:CR=1 FL=1